MKCPVCGTNLNKGITKCQKCGCIVEANAVDQPYTGKTKSKAIAGILMLFGIGDLYLLDYGKFIKKLGVYLFTFGIGGVIWSLIDAVRVFTGNIDCDVKGVPLV